MTAPDPDHPGLYLVDGVGFVPDPDHPGYYLRTRAGMAGDRTHPGLYSVADPGVFSTDPAYGMTSVWVRMGASGLRPGTVAGATSVAVELVSERVAVPGRVDPGRVTGSTSITVEMYVAAPGELLLEPVRSRTAVRIASYARVELDTVRGVTAVGVGMELVGVRGILTDRVQGTTDVRVVRRPDLSRNAPVLLGFTATGRLESVEPQRAGETGLRAVAGRVVNLPVPAISDGQPSLPWFWARVAAAATLVEGPAHIHAIADPNPVWDPATSGWTFPPVPVSNAPGGGSAPGGGAGDLRWAMDTLPDPAAHKGGWYWLGDDGGGGTPAGFHEWPVSPGSAAGPSWHSFYPFRPQVAAYDGYVGSKKIHHPKGLHVNSHYAEHMWLDLGADQQQPFTWIMVAAVNSDPFAGYQHNLLDSGHNPNDVGFGRISAAAVSTERRINDNLPYRTSLTMVGDTGQIATSIDAPLRTKGSPGHHPRMYAAIYNGFATQLGVYDTFGKYLANGSVASGAAYNHRFIVMGREQGWISQRHASNIMVFEIRYWHRALTKADLDAQYAQLSSTHQFDAYKQL